MKNKIAEAIRNEYSKHFGDMELSPDQLAEIAVKTMLDNLPEANINPKTDQALGFNACLDEVRKRLL